MVNAALSFVVGFVIHPYWYLIRSSQQPALWLAATPAARKGAVQLVTRVGLAAELEKALSPFPDIGRSPCGTARDGITARSSPVQQPLAASLSLRANRQRIRKTDISRQSARLAAGECGAPWVRLQNRHSGDSGISHTEVFRSPNYEIPIHFSKARPLHRSLPERESRNR